MARKNKVEKVKRAEGDKAVRNIQGASGSKQKGGLTRKVRIEDAQASHRAREDAGPNQAHRYQCRRRRCTLKRFVPHFPAAGEVVIFDRSWYNRAGVERVMGFCAESEYKRFLKVCPYFERLIADYGIILIKYWFEVSQDEQTRRFEQRIKDARKFWKLSPMDLESHRRWYDYSRARDAMFASSDSEESPWYVVKADDKRRARLNCIAHLLSLIPYKEAPSGPVKLPKRQKSKGYSEPDYKYRFVPEKY